MELIFIFVLLFIVVVLVVGLVLCFFSPSEWDHPMQHKVQNRQTSTPKCQSNINTLNCYQTLGGTLIQKLVMC